MYMSGIPAASFILTRQGPPQAVGSVRAPWVDESRNAEPPEAIRALSRLLEPHAGPLDTSLSLRNLWPGSRRTRFGACHLHITRCSPRDCLFQASVLSAGFSVPRDR